MFAKADYEKGYEYVEKNRTNPSFQSHYIRWRVARFISTSVNSLKSFFFFIRALYKYSETVKDKQLKKKLVEDAYEQAKLALNEGNHISAVHKWYGIILNERSQYISTEEQIRSAFEVLDHFEEAVRLNPQDPNTYYLLGAWYIERLTTNLSFINFYFQVLGSITNIRLETSFVENDLWGITKSNRS